MIIYEIVVGRADMEEWYFRCFPRDIVWAAKFAAKLRLEGHDIKIWVEEAHTGDVVDFSTYREITA